MRVIFIGSALSIALIASLARAQAAEPSPQALDLSRQIVDFDGERARLAKLDALGALLPPQIDRTLDLHDPAQQQKIADLVKTRLQAMQDKLISVRIEAMAEIYPLDVLQGGLTFRHSPTGEALRKAQPALEESLTAAVFADKPATIDASTSPAKRVLIDRIIKAQDVEGSARKGWRMLMSVMSQAATAVGNADAAKAASSEDTADETAYAQRMVAGMTQFYAQTFSEAQLADLATYFEGPVGQAFVAGGAKLKATAGPAAVTALSAVFDHFSDEACAAVACAPAQRTALDGQIGKLQAVMSAATKSLVQ